jgi:ribosomal protein S18 acetylase RimI-like enzyme
MMIENRQNIEYAPLSTVPGLTFRHFAGESDYEITLDLWLKNREFNGNEWILTMEDIHIDQQWRTNYDPNEQLVFVEQNNTPIGYLMYHWSLEESPRTYILIVYMNLLEEYWEGPIPQLILDFIETKLTELDKDIPAHAPHRFDLTVKQKNTIQMDFFTRNGYIPERYFIDMVRPIDAPLGEYHMPEGLEIRPVKPEDYRKVWDAHLDAFRDHWGFEERNEEQFIAWQEDTWFQPDLWKVAWDGEEIAGRVGNYFLEDENKAFQRKRGYTDSISVSRKWRERGLAKALIAESIRMFKEMGMEETALGVDTANLTGALKLYTGLGYKEVPGKTSIVMRKTLKQNYLEKQNE